MQPNLTLTHGRSRAVVTQNCCVWLSLPPSASPKATSGAISRDVRLVWYCVGIARGRPAYMSTSRYYLSEPPKHHALLSFSQAESSAWERRNAYSRLNASSLLAARQNYPRRSNIAIYRRRPPACAVKPPAEVGQNEQFVRFQRGPRDRVQCGGKHDAEQDAGQNA